MNIKQTNLYNLLRRIRRLWRIRPYFPSHFTLLIKDLYLIRNGVKNIRNIVNNNAEHLKAVFEWLCLAQDINHDGGVAGLYRLDTGWTASYPETTGYIIPTFFNYYRYTGNDKYKDRAIAMSDWVVSIQMNNGAFQGELIDVLPKPEVFNTGQVLGGLIRAYEETKNNKYIDSAIRAGDWLVNIQNDDGAWRQYTYGDLPRTYHSRIAWFLLELYKYTKDNKYLQSSLRQLNWSLSHQQDNGFFDNCAFDDVSPPFIHTISYAVEGFLESGIILNQSKYINAARRVANVLLNIFEENGFLAGHYNNGWTSNAQYTCLTGNAQISFVWLRFYEITKEIRYLNAAIKMNNHLKSLQDLNNNNKGIKGGIKGSHPIWGNYMSYRYTNWAAKFFADTLMLEDKIKQNL